MCTPATNNGKMSVDTVLNTLMRTVLRVEAEAKKAAIDPEKLEQDARKQFAANIANGHYDLANVDLNEEYEAIERKFSKKMTTKVDLKPYLALEKEIEALHLRLQIKGEDCVRTSLEVLAEKIEKL